MNIYQQNKYVTCFILLSIFNDILMKHTPSHNCYMRKHIVYKISIVNPTPDKTFAYVRPILWNPVIMKNHIEECTPVNILKDK